MSYANARITLHSGEAHFTTAYPDAVAKAIEEGRAADKALVSFESTATPTGQMFYIDPRDVASIKVER